MTLRYFALPRTKQSPVGEGKANRSILFNCNISNACILTSQISTTCTALQQPVHMSSLCTLSLWTYWGASSIIQAFDISSRIFFQRENKYSRKCHYVLLSCVFLQQLKLKYRYVSYFLWQMVLYHCQKGYVFSQFFSLWFDYFSLRTWCVDVN